MILTISVNSALDRVIFIDRFEPGAVMQADRMTDSVGGKGFDTSLVLSALKADQLALGFVAGNVGRMLVGLLDKYHVRYDLIWVEGETRMANVLVETDLHRDSHIMTPGYSLADKDIRLLFDKIQRYLPSTTWMIVAGSLPKGCPADTYARMIELAAGQNVKTLLDCRGIEMKEGIKSRPDIVKMNNRELKETFGREAIDLPTTGQATFSLLNEYNLESVVVTCGKKGIVAAVKGDGVYYAVPPQLKAVNSAGAGDAVSAVLAYRFTQGDSWSQALQWSGAVSAAVVVTEATAVCDEKQVLAIYPRVRISQVNF